MTTWQGLLLLTGCYASDFKQDAGPDAAERSPAKLVVSSTTVAIPDTAVGSSRASAALTVTNVGGVTTGTISITSPLPDFGGGGTCNILLSLGTCVALVTFTPTHTGSTAADIVISASPGGHVSVHATGTGVPTGLQARAGYQQFAASGDGAAATARAVTTSTSPR